MLATATERIKTMQVLTAFDGLVIFGPFLAAVTLFAIGNALWGR